MSATWGDGERVAAGQEVTVRDGDDQTVGIWLVYPNRCETDITYNFVPSGTAATLVGEWCQIDQQWYARIAFDEVTRKKHSIQGDNLWLPLAQLQRVEVAP